MKNERTQFLARLETGFRMDRAHLEELEHVLALAVLSARHFGAAYGGGWDIRWQKLWDDVEGILGRIRLLVNEMENSSESVADRVKGSAEPWTTLEAEDDKLVAALVAIRTHASRFNAEVRDDWNLLAPTLEWHLGATRAWAQATRIKTQLLKKHSREEVEQMVQGVLARLPDRAQTEGMSAEIYEQEFSTAVKELDREHHKFLGLIDAVKALLLWVESPEERTSKKLSLHLEVPQLQPVL